MSEQGCLERDLQVDTRQLRLAMLQVARMAASYNAIQPHEGTASALYDFH
jgi:hypothetical protein